ncbi:MAG: TerD family protein, partial [Mycobacteriaceae bacterium]
MLRKGENINLDAPRVRITVAPEQPVVALLVDAEQRARTSSHLLSGEHLSAPGVRCSPEGLEIDTAAVPAGVHAVRCLVEVTDAAAPTATVLDEGGTVLATYRATDLTVERTVVLVEVYRRGASWKVRAVGQGYDGGLDAAAADHGITLQLPVPTPTDVSEADLVRHLRGVWEDAARSCAAYVSACTFAESRYERDAAAAVADVHRRGTPEAEAARAAARERHDDLVARADTVHERDMAQLVAETVGLEAALPAPAAEWDAGVWARWQPPGVRGAVLRLGTVHTDLAPQLRVPLLAGLPLAVPLWVDVTGDPAGGAGLLRALVLRIIAAQPAGTIQVHVVDLVATLGATLGTAAGTTVGRDELGVVLGQLLAEVDLAQMAAQVGERRTGQHLLVLHGLPYGLEEDTLGRLLTLVRSGPPAGVSLIVTGEQAELLGRSTDRLLAALTEGMQRVPVTADGTLNDPWTGGEWVFT